MPETAAHPKLDGAFPTTPLYTNHAIGLYQVQPRNSARVPAGRLDEVRMIRVIYVAAR